MIDDIREHLSHYIVLTAILLSGIVAFVWFMGQENIQLVAMILMGVGYVLWGIMHHKHEADVTHTLVLEYILTALLVIILVWGVMHSI